MPAFARGISIRGGLTAVVLALTGAALLLVPAGAAPAAVPAERTPGRPRGPIGRAVRSGAAANPTTRARHPGIP